MKKSIICVALLAALCTGCAVPVEVRKDQVAELKALGDYHKAEKAVIRANKAKAVAAGALISATAIQLKAESDLKQTKVALEGALSKQGGEDEAE